MQAAVVAGASGQGDGHEVSEAAVNCAAVVADGRAAVFADSAFFIATVVAIVVHWWRLCPDGGGKAGHHVAVVVLCRQMHCNPFTLAHCRRQ